MSKKIIYLLSLLMALSLVFASCKKNGAGTGPDIGNNPPHEEDNTTGVVNVDTGLVDSFDKLPADKVIKKETIFEGDGVNYLRNPVIVVMGAQSNQVAVFAEKRYKSKGADNDVGINGESAVDIVYRFSGNAGVRFGAEAIVGKGAAGPKDSHGAPIVYKVGDNKVVVVASAGGGIARTSEAAHTAGQGTETKPDSKIEYIVGTLSGESFTWGAWTEVQFSASGDLLKKVQEQKAPNGDNYTQMGTHSAKGHVATDGQTLMLPVVMAQQGVIGSGAKELMGVYFVTGKVNDNTVAWTDTTKHIEFKTQNNANFSEFKETRVIDDNNSTDLTDVKYIAVPNPGYGADTYGLGEGPANQPTPSAISGHFGSPGYLTLNWYGAKNYTPTEYSQGVSSEKKSLFLGVKTQNTDVTLYLVAQNTLTSEGSYLVNAIGKSGSIDVLGDGTVVTAAEEGSNGDRNYYTSFTRYSQAYLTSLLK